MAAYAMDPELRAAADAEALRRHREHAVRTGLTLDLREGTTAEAESDAMHAANAVSHQHHIAGLKHQREADGAARLRHDRERVRALQASPNPNLIPNPTPNPKPVPNPNPNCK